MTTICDVVVTVILFGIVLAGCKKSPRIVVWTVKLDCILVVILWCSGVGYAFILSSFFQLLTWQYSSAAHNWLIGADSVGASGLKNPWGKLCGCKAPTEIGLVFVIFSIWAGALTSWTCTKLLSSALFSPPNAPDVIWQQGSAWTCWEILSAPPYLSAMAGDKSENKGRDRKWGGERKKGSRQKSEPMNGLVSSNNAFHSTTDALHNIFPMTDISTSIANVSSWKKLDKIKAYPTPLHHSITTK